MFLSALRSRPGTKQTYPADTPSNTPESDVKVLRDGDLAYVRAKGGNDSGPSYQEAMGAPVEGSSPLGYHVGWLTVIFLNVNQMIGTGIFSTRMSYVCKGFFGGCSSPYRGNPGQLGRGNTQSD